MDAMGTVSPKTEPWKQEIPVGNQHFLGVILVLESVMLYLVQATGATFCFLNSLSFTKHDDVTFAWANVPLMQRSLKAFCRCNILCDVPYCF